MTINPTYSERLGQAAARYRRRHPDWPLSECLTAASDELEAEDLHRSNPDD